MALSDFNHVKIDLVDILEFSINIKGRSYVQSKSCFLIKCPLQFITITVNTSEVNEIDQQKLLGSLAGLEGFVKLPESGGIELNLKKKNEEVLASLAVDVVVLTWHEGGEEAYRDVEFESFS